MSVPPSCSTLTSDEYASLDDHAPVPKRVSSVADTVSDLGLVSVIEPVKAPLLSALNSIMRTLSGTHQK